MKGIKFDGYSLALGGLLGVCAGFGLGHLLRRKAFAAQLDVEVAKVKDRYNDRLRELLASTVEDEPEEPATTWNDVVARTLPAPVPLRPTTQGYGAGPSSRRKRGGQEDQPSGGDPVSEDAGEDSAAYLAEQQAIEDEIASGEAIAVTEEEVTKFMTSVPDRGVIYPVSKEEAGEVDAGWQTACVKWFEESNTLVDEADSPIPNIAGTVGPLGPDCFGEDPQNPLLYYVKNHRLEIIFEIELDRRSYQYAVLGYGNPAVESGETIS